MDSSSIPVPSRRDALKQVACLAASASLSAASVPAPEAAGVLDLVIIGGGPAGLSAAMVMARARRSVLLIDGGTPRNAAAPAVHTFVTRDGVLPSEFRTIARGQLARYPTVRFREGLAASIQGAAGDFSIKFADGAEARGRAILLVPGLTDRLPGIPGVRENWGKGVHHCVFCDGYEHRDKAWGLLVEDPQALEHVPFFQGWTRDLTVFPHGMEMPEQARRDLARTGIKIEERPIRALRAGPGGIEGAELADGGFVPLQAFWLQPEQDQTPLVKSLGLALREDGAVERSESGETSREGIFAAGDVCAGKMQQALLAAADGARVAYFLSRQAVLASLRRA